ncbi:MAG: hypothetical protein H5U38_12155, partial [Calditrichaeota bacterium]|nr:hypothetical protein [Calditrichota bacterium]
MGIFPWLAVFLLAQSHRFLRFAAVSRPRQAPFLLAENKLAPPFREAQFDIIFGEGISREGDLVDCGIQYG